MFLCSKCKIEKNEDERYTHSKKKRHNICKICERQQVKKRYIKNAEKIREQKRTARNTEHGMKMELLNGARRRAREKGLEFNLKAQDIPQIPEMCPILNIRIQRGKSKVCHTSPSLDRIDSKRGYTPNNVQVISARANMLKNDATREELEQILEWMKTIENT